MPYNPDSYEEIRMFGSGKRCGIQHAPWMGDWFTSWSPRNSNSNAEGPWDHFVDLAIGILQDPLTQLVRPDAHAAVAELKTLNLYDESARPLTEDELRARFTPSKPPQS